MKCAELLIKTLSDYGVRRIYGLAGDSLNGITDSLRRSENMEWIHVRHEEVAAFAAGAEAQLTGKLTVCAGSCGPGNLHLINGLYDCQRSRVPVLAIAAQIPSAELGSAYFQETHPEILFKDCSHFCEFVSSPEQLPRILAIAMRTAITRRGVAVVVIPGDVALRKCPSPPMPLGLSGRDSSLLPALSDIAAAAQILNSATRVAILGGAGCAGAHAELMAVAERLKAPIVHAMRGKEFIEYDNPFDVGMTGLLGFSSGFHAMMSCDTLLMLGTDFPYQQFYPQDAKIIQVDRRGEQIGRRTRVDLGLVGDTQATLAALQPQLREKTERGYLDQALAHYKKSRAALDELATGGPGGAPLHPQFVAKTIDEVAGADTVFTCDVGTPTIWAARYLRMNGSRRLLGSFTHGSMASALPQAIGAQSLDRQRQVVAFCGDGGLAMLLGDLLTLRQARLPVKIVVFNNGSLGFVELEMKAAGVIDFATDLLNPNFADLARAAGLLGIRVDTAEELRPALEAAFSQPGPALVDVRVHRQELAMPPKITLEQAEGFGLYVMRAVLNGRSDEIVELVKTNIFR